MPHTTEIVEYKKLSNGQFAVCIRCCGNASTDWWHTMAAEVAADQQRAFDSIGKARQGCADLHDKAAAAETVLVAQMGKVEEHK